MEPQALSLGGQVSALLQGILEELEVRGLEESLGGSNGVRRVGDDNVVLVFVVGEELESISDVDGDSWILVAFRHMG